MFRFDEAKYLSDFKKISDLRPQIERIVDEMMKRPVENIFLIGIGGTISLMYPMEIFIKKNSAIPVYTANAAEIVHMPGKALTEKSLAVLYSESGETKETVAAAEFCRNRGIRTIGVSGKENSSLYNALVYPIYSSEGDEFSSDGDYIRLYMIIGRMLKNLGDFPQYVAFMEELEKLPRALVETKKNVEELAKNFAETYKDEPFHMLTGAGNQWGETYCYAMCILEEMQWIRTQSIHAAEFFHGALEIIEKDTSVIIFKGEDEARPLTDRVENFARRYTDKVTVIDTAEFAKGMISAEFRADMSPVLLSAALGRVSPHLERTRNHSLDLRRYYRTVEY